MNPKKLIAVLLCLTAMLTALVAATSCGGDDITTDAATTALPDDMKAMNYETVYKNKLDGLVPYSAESSDPFVASANVMPKRTGVSIVAYHSGKATLTVKDCFGFEAKLDVTVADDYAITYNVVSTQMGDFFEVQTDGGVSATGSADVTNKIQAILDAAAPGDTVYFYPGIYKIDKLAMREGVNLALATTMTDATVGYTDEIRADFDSGADIAVLKGNFVLNNNYGKRGADGAGNFSITGGAITGSAPTYFVFTCAENIQVKNMIVKDITEAHAFQVSGCNNVTIENCMFAGYTFTSTFPREIVQIEQTGPGVTGAVSNQPLTFENGEIYRNENISIKHCYFGKSDKMDPPVIAIGHHGATGYATVKGFEIKDCVFDECKHSAIRYSNIVDVEITGNKFISTAKYKNINHSSATNPAFIVLYNGGNGMTTFNSIVNGAKVTIPTYQSGCHNVNIENNTFDIAEGSDKKVFYAKMEANRMGAKYETALMVADRFDARPTVFNGYVDKLNTVSNLNFAENTVNISGQPAYKDNFFYSMATVGLKVDGNTVNLADGVSFTSANDGMNGFSINFNASGVEASYRYIEMAKLSYYVSLRNSEGEELSRVSANGKILLTLASDGNGSVTTSCDGGNVIVTVTPNEGYVFDGWYRGNAKVTSDLVISANTVLTAKFVAK